MKKTVFILVPSPHPTGPVKGAYALANALAHLRRVVLVFLKTGPGVNAPLHEKVEVRSLAQTEGGWRLRLAAYRKLLEDAGGRRCVVSISMCLSADWINRFCNVQAVTCASVRGNLPKNYRLDYGLLGVPLALGHLFALRTFDHVVAMTDSMASQLRLLAGLEPRVIGNFVDEGALERHRQTGTTSGPLRFVFVGSLSERKQPKLVIAAIEKLRDQDVELDVLGDGPLYAKLCSLVDFLGLQGRVRLHGQVANPHVILAAADAFVLPSRSEGVSRAALEALYLGVPCVLRDVDGNADLLAVPASGALFVRDEDLATAMLQAAQFSRDCSGRNSLLPQAFQQISAASKYLYLLEHSA
jgi:glycosyltransferase involved in cell wall biosynthesis